MLNLLTYAEFYYFIMLNFTTLLNWILLYFYAEFYYLTMLNFFYWLIYIYIYTVFYDLIMLNFITQHAELNYLFILYSILKNKLLKKVTHLITKVFFIKPCRQRANNKVQWWSASSINHVYFTSSSNQQTKHFLDFPVSCNVNWSPSIKISSANTKLIIIMNGLQK